jgi:hypothetical protein
MSVLEITGVGTGVARAGISKCMMRLLLLLACASPLRAQTFVEVGGGWNYVPLHPSTTGNVLRPHGFNLRGAIGRVITPRVRVRVDAFTVQFNDKIPVYPYQPCSSLDCAPVQHEAYYAGSVSGVAANGLVNIDPHGVVYLVGGVGLFSANELHLGVSAGAGLTVPVGLRLRGFAEARWIGPFNRRAVASWAVPITVGLRY